MNAKQLYNYLEHDFRLSACDDDWEGMDMNEYITAQYRSRYMGLVTDNTDVINYVYTAVFPSQAVIEKITTENALLFVHHPMKWDITKNPVFTDIPIETLKSLKERKVSIYNLHAPLDTNGPYSTTVNFAEALGINVTDEFYEYHKVNVGIIGTIDCQNIKQRFENAVGHEVKVYQYGDDTIKNNKVALVAGGGNDAAVYPYLRKLGINTFLTGVAGMRDDYRPSADAHDAAKENGVNILAGTHYSTEKFACMKMAEYFSRHGISGEFIPDSPCMEDL